MVEEAHGVKLDPLLAVARAAGAEILNAADCRDACNQFQLDINPKLLKDGRPCYKNGRGQCAQKGAIGGKAMRICKK